MTRTQIETGVTYRVRRIRDLTPLVIVAALMLGACSSGDETAQPAPVESSTTTPAPASTGTAVAAGTPCDQPDDTVTVAYRTIPGVDTALTSLDVHPVAGICDAPIVMWVHGGGYRIGDKANQITDKARLFNQRGWVLVSLNYRLTEPGEDTSAQYPDHFDDVAAAVAWVRAEIDAYGGDRGRIALLGHSAGADIVSNVAVNPVYLEAHGLALDDLSCAGPFDTAGFDKTSAGAIERKQWQAALGNAPDHERTTSATFLIERDIGIAPMLVPARGIERRRRIQTDFADVLVSAGISATTIDAASLTHAEINSQIGAPGDAVMTEPLVRFLDQCFV